MIERLRYFAGLFNWGDDINPVLYEMITGRKPVKMHVLDKTPEEHLMMCGSILNFANEHSVIWGSGFMHRKNTLEGCSMDFAKQVHAVRGPLTAKRLGELGIEVDVPYGDPAMLIPRFQQLGEVLPRYEYGVVPHYIDKLRVEGWPDDILRIDVGDDTFTFINQVLKCKKIISSSLHGLILADMFNIPALWVKLSNNLAGDDMKFHDYFASIGRKDVEFFDMRGGYDEKVKNAFVDYKVNIDLDRLYEACPIRSK